MPNLICMAQLGQKDSNLLDEEETFRGSLDFMGSGLWKRRATGSGKQQLEKQVRAIP